MHCPNACQNSRQESFPAALRDEYIYIVGYTPFGMVITQSKECYAFYRARRILQKVDILWQVFYANGIPQTQVVIAYDEYLVGINTCPIRNFGNMLHMVYRVLQLMGFLYFPTKHDSNVADAVPQSQQALF